MPRIQLRRGTAAEWTAANPVLARGEPGVETDTGVFAVGDGVTPWDTLQNKIDLDSTFVVSVNGQPGPDVTLTAIDVGADPAGSAAAAATDVAAQVSAEPVRVPARAMSEGNGTPTWVPATAAGLPGWSLDNGESVVFQLPDLPLSWGAIEFEVIYSLGVGAGGAFGWGGEVRRGDIAKAATVDTALAGANESVASSWPDGSILPATLRYTAPGGPITATGPAADTSTDPDTPAPVADRRMPLAVEISAGWLFAVGPFVIHEVRVRDNTYGRTLLGTDLIGSWWTRPRTTVAADGRVWVGGVKATGQTAIGRANVATSPPTVAEQGSLGVIEEDDHNNPALVVPAATRPPVVVYAGHAIDTLLRYRVGTAVEDVLGLIGQPEQSIDMGPGNAVTYAEVHARPDVGDGELHVLTRAPTQVWRYVRSTDWAATWAAPVPLWEFEPGGLAVQSYVASSALLPDGRTIRCAAFPHPSDALGNLSGNHDIWAWQIDLASGDVTPIGGGAILGNVQTGAGLPLSRHTAPLAYATPAGRTVHVFDVASGPTPMIVYAEKDADNATTTDSVYRVLRWTGTTWEAQTIAETGQHFGWAVGYYVGGGAHARHSDATLWLSREHQGMWTIERWASPDAGATWAHDEVVDRMDQPLVRPFAVDGADGHLDVTYYRLHRFEGFGPDGFYADLMGA